MDVDVHKPTRAGGGAMSDPAGGPLNGERLAMLQAAGGGEGLVAELVDLFVDDVPARLESIREAMAAGDPEALLQTAHSLKGSAATLGADRMAEICRQMEVSGRAGEMPQGEGLFESLEAEFEQVKRALADWVAAL
jgi:HPt (histidine-containing phosphotransfer) domain-containing protein